MGSMPVRGSEQLAYNNNWVQINDRPANWRSWLIIDRNYGRWTQNAADWVYAHESGHLMGLPDDYTDVNGQSVATPGHEGHMMASYNGRVVWHEVLDITGPVPP